MILLRRKGEDALKRDFPVFAAGPASALQDDAALRGVDLPDRIAQLHRAPAGFPLVRHKDRKAHAGPAAGCELAFDPEQPAVEQGQGVFLEAALRLRQPLLLRDQIGKADERVISQKLRGAIDEYYENVTT